MVAWFRAFLPKEERFFTHFNNHAQIVVAGAEALRSLLDGGDEVPHYCQVIKARENEADEITHEVLLAVRRTFITPFDRGDIKDLINAMDDAIDQMHQTAKTITLFEVRSFEPEMREMGDLIVQAARLMAEAVPLLASINKQAARLGILTDEITHIEGRADDIHDEGLRKLFHTHRNNDPMAYIVGTELYSRLERVMDRLEDVANEVHGIVIENV
jgi:predicted phosphate transport protein (TIGR00153 family)